MLQTLRTLFKRDLQKLKSEIEAYQSEDKLWVIDKSIANSAGNLCLHLVGNLNGIIGAQMGSSGYVRQRDLEFSLKDISRSELIQKIDSTIEVVDKTLSSLKEDELQQIHPHQLFAEKTSVEYLLIHLATHLSYHLGQVNYHRRLLDVR